MRRLLLLCTISWLLAADDRWVKFTRGPFEVMTDAGARSGRETMVRFEQFRNALGQIVGEDDFETPLPLRIFVFKNARELLVGGRQRLVIEGMAMAGEKASPVRPKEPIQ